MRLIPALLIAAGMLWGDHDDHDDDKDERKEDHGFKFKARIESLPGGIAQAGNWLIGGRAVRVSSGTKLVTENGPFAVGACTEVRGEMSGSGIDASRITTLQARECGGSGGPTALDFFGNVERLPASGLIGEWRVSTRTVRVTAATKIVQERGPVAVGVCVEINGLLRTDGSIDASQVETKSSARGCTTAPGQSKKVVEFEGVIQRLPAGGALTGDWTVSGRVVHIPALNVLAGQTALYKIGACVDVRGESLSDGSITASMVKIGNECTAGQSGPPRQTGPGRYDFVGTVQTIPASGGVGDWKIGGRTIHADFGTTLDVTRGLLQPGACVQVTGSLESDGSMRATRIETESTSGACIFPGGVVGGGSMAGTAVAAGEIVSIFGLNIGPAAQLPLVLGTDNKVTTSLGETRVLFDGAAATLLYASGGQVNAVVPFAVSGKTSTLVQVEINGIWSNALTVTVAPSAPSIFTLNGSGKGQGAILNYIAASGGFTVNGPQAAAPRTSIVTVYGTGFGQTNPPGVDGSVTNPFAPIPRTVLPVSAMVGGKAAAVLFAGAAPGYVAGVIQVNLIVAADAAVGSAVPIVITVGTASSQEGVTIAVR